MEIDYINGPKTYKIFGMSKYQMEIHKRLDIKLNIIEYDSIMYNLEKRYIPTISTNETPMEYYNNISSRDTSKLKNFLIELGKTVFKNIDRYKYQLEVKKNIKDANIKHITSQEFAYLLNSIKMDMSVVTCYDLIPWAFEKNHSKIWKNNIAGLKKAKRIMTISEFSKSEIIKYLDYPEDKIHIVSPAVDHDVYFENENKEILNKFHISNEEKVVLYVGSETPRMNVPVLIKAFSKLKKKIPGIKMVKIGESQSYGARENILKLINELDLQDDIIFVGYVKEEDMPRWYNAADILVYPCTYAGFGLPPLEAMSCGTPVITSNTTSLPEVVGDAGLMVNPQNFELMADMIYNLLKDDELRNDMIIKGLKRAKMFSWDESAKKTLKIYKMMI